MSLPKSSSMLLELIFHLVRAIEKTNGVLQNINTFLPTKDKHTQKEQDKTHGYLEKQEDVNDVRESCEECEEKKISVSSNLVFSQSSSAKLASSSTISTSITSVLSQKRNKASIKSGKTKTKFTSTSAHSYSSRSSISTSPPQLSPPPEKNQLLSLPSVTKSFTLPSFMSSVSQY